MQISFKRTYYTTLEILFLILWTFYSVYYFLLSACEFSYDYYSFANPAIIYCNYFMVVLLIFYWLISFFQNSKWHLGALLQYVVFLFIVFLVELNISDTTLMIFVLFIMAAQFIDFDKLLRYDIKVKLIMLAVIFGMCALGIVENRVGDYYSGYKQAFGFTHANTMACYVITILVEWLCIRYKKMKWYDWAGIVLSTIALSYFSNGRTSIYSFIVIFILFIFANQTPGFFYNKIVQLILAVVTPVMALVSFLSVRLYAQGNSFVQEIDELMSGRIRLAYYAVTVKGIKLFGQEIQFSNRLHRADNRTRFLVDNAYIHMALRWGFLILLFIVIAYSFLLIKLIRLGKINLALMALFFALLGLGETYMNNVLYNLSLLCLLSASSDKIGQSSLEKKL